MHTILATVGTDGDVFPHIGLGAALRARGHRVTLAAPETYRARAAALGLDPIDHLLRHRDIGARAITGAAEVVDHDRRALAREQFGIGLTEPAARTGDQRHLAVE